MSAMDSWRMTVIWGTEEEGENILRGESGKGVEALKDKWSKLLRYRTPGRAFLVWDLRKVGRWCSIMKEFKYWRKFDLILLKTDLSLGNRNCKHWQMTGQLVLQQMLIEARSRWMFLLQPLPVTFWWGHPFLQHCLSVQVHFVHGQHCQMSPSQPRSLAQLFAEGKVCRLDSVG